jgi:diguanylate cyclase
VLKYVALALQSMSKEASIARYGGDEFAVFLESDQSERGKDLGEAICEHFAQTSLKDDQAGITLDRVTTSIGIARLRDDDDRESWFDRADKLLYNAKQLGRNRVVAERDLSESRTSNDQ